LAAKPLELWAYGVVGEPSEFRLGHKTEAEVLCCQKGNGAHRKPTFCVAQDSLDERFQCTAMAVILAVTHDFAGGIRTHLSIQ
jgi:hypothetical protein